MLIVTLLLALAALALLAFACPAFAAVGNWQIPFLQGTPRSIFETRRAGMA